MILLYGKWDHQLSFEIVNLLILFQAQPSCMQLWSQCTLKCPFFFFLINIILVGNCFIAPYTRQRACSLLQRHFADIQEAQAPVLATSWRIFIINCRWAAKVEHTHLPCPSLASHIVLRCFYRCVCSRDHRRSSGEPLPQLPPPSHFPGSVTEKGFAKLSQKLPDKRPQCYHGTDGESLWSLSHLWCEHRSNWQVKKYPCLYPKTCHWFAVKAPSRYMATIFEFKWHSQT